MRKVRHAYLIIAHKNIRQLQKLISLLDDSRNDIFVFIDKKAQMVGSENLGTKYSKLCFVQSHDVIWGGYTQIGAELTLFENAYRSGDYRYFHLLSGQDLPLHNQNYIHNFFEKNDGYEFFTFVGEEILQRNKPQERFQYRYFFEKHIKLSRYVVKLQKMLKLRRNMQWKEVGYGANWVSCTNDFVEFMLSERENIERMFKNSFCCDEVYKHLLILNSLFKDKVFVKTGVNDRPEDRQGNLRYINWWDGNPKTWTIEDKKELENARDRGYLFSRKFDEQSDKEIIEWVVHMIENEQESMIIETL